MSYIIYLLITSDAKYQKLMSQLCNVEYQADKTWLVRQMAVREQDRYDSLHKEIGMYVCHSVTFIGLGLSVLLVCFIHYPPNTKYEQ